jgi:hypothetical protein
MMAANKKTSPIRSYLAKDYGDFRAELLKYAKTYFPDKIQDFSEASVGGLMLDMAAAVGDNMSYYLDHQFRELSWSDAVEIQNIERLIRNNGVKIVGESPATVTLTFFIEVPATTTAGRIVPDRTSLPVILENTVVDSTNGVSFSTVEDLDFGETDKFGNLFAKVQVGDTSAAGIPLTFILSRKVIAVSGKIYTENFTFTSSYQPFRTITLTNANVSEVISVTDTDGNNWYEVESLTQDTVFLGVVNKDEDNNLVRESLEVVPAPRRFMTNVNLQNRKTSLQFGGGDPTLADDDVFPDPSKLSLPTYGRNTIPRFSLDPNSLIRSKTLGVSPVSTTLTVSYRAGGGINHNVGVNTIRSIRSIRIEFRNSPVASIASSVRASLDVLNDVPATGGAPAPTIDQMRSLIPAARNAQQRVVTKADLIARVYSLPSRFGRVFRAGVRSNPNNPLASQLFILSQNERGKLIQSPDTLKKNIRKYLNEYRLISDAIDVVDARIINYSVSVSIIPTPDANVNNVIRDVILSIQEKLSIRNFQIDQSLKIADVVNAVINVPGVLSVTRLDFQNMRGRIDGREYSDAYFDVNTNIIKGLIVGPPGSIFELRYPNFDVIVSTG